MTLDGMALSALVWEFNTHLSGGRIDKIHQPGRDEIVLHIRSNSGAQSLLLSAAPNTARVHICAEPPPNPAQPPMFCILLRKYLQGGRILKFEQMEFDRVLCIRTECKDALGDIYPYSLYIEIMGRHSNIALVGRDGIILGCARHVGEDKSRVRQLLPGLPYTSVPAQDKINPMRITQSELRRLISVPTPLRAEKFFMQNFSGVGSHTARELALRTLRDADASISAAPTHAESFAAAFFEFFNHVRAGYFQPRILYKPDGMPMGYLCLDYLHMSGIPFKATQTMSEAVEQTTLERARQERLKSQTQTLDRAISRNIERCEKRVALHTAELNKQDKLDELRQYGELLTAQLYKVTPGSTFALVDDYYHDGQTVKIPLDPARTPSGNAQGYFKRYAKLKSGVDMAHEHIKSAQDEMAYLFTLQNALEQSNRLDELIEIRQELEKAGYLKPTHAQKKGTKKQKLPPTQPESYTSSTGMTILVGKNNAQNDRLTLRTAGPGDIWLHAKDIAGSHVVVRLSDGAEIDEVTLKEAAGLAAWHSKARTSTRVPVDYTRCKYVKKPSGSPPGYVIYTHQKTLYVEPTKQGWSEQCPGQPHTK